MKQIDKEYAEALFELSCEEGTTIEYIDELKSIKAAIEENPEYLDYLSSPAAGLGERLSAIDEAFANLPENIVSFLKLLCENGRINVLVSCIDEFIALAMALSGRNFATVYSAVELSDSQKTAVCEKLKKLTGKEIDANYIIDKSLIGGIKIDIDGQLIDGSVKRRLSDIKDVIIG